MANSNVIPLSALVLLTIALIYWVATQQPFVVDAAPSEHQLNSPEKFLAALVAFGIFATLFIALRRAYYAGSKFWFVVCLFVWPISFVYTLLVNRADER